MKRMEQIRRGTILQLFKDVSRDTPVAKGLLRGNWQTAIGQPKNSIIERKDKAGTQVEAEISGNLGEYGDTIHLTNNLPYAKVAEYGEWNGPTALVTAKGFSRKASKGMMRKNAIRFNKLLAKRVKSTQSR